MQVFETRGLPIPGGPWIDFQRPTILDEQKAASLFSLTSPWNCAFPLIVNVSNETSFWEGSTSFIGLSKGSVTHRRQTIPNLVWTLILTDDFGWVLERLNDFSKFMQAGNSRVAIWILFYWLKPACFPRHRWFFPDHSLCAQPYARLYWVGEKWWGHGDST